MTPLERYRAILRGEPADFLPRVPILMQFAARYIGSNYGAFVSDHRVLVESQCRCAEDFGMDQLSVISDPYRETAGFGGEILIDEHGPRCEHPPLEDDRDLRRLAEPDPLRSPRMADRVDAVRAFNAWSAGRHSILGWIEGPAAEAADLRGLTNFLMDLMDDEAYCGELMDRCVEVGIDFAAAQIEAGADTIGVGDAICSQISPDIYDRLIWPRQKRLFEAIRARGGLVRLHICGNITHLLPRIAELPIDILDLDHMVDMARARAAVPAHVALAGNLDPVAAVMRGTPGSIRAQLRAIYETVGNPLLINAGCEIPPGTPHENFRALCEPVACEGASPPAHHETQA